MENKGLSRTPRLVLGVLTLLFAGIIYAWSILKSPLGDAFGWTPADLAFNYTLTICFFCLGGLISGIMAKKTSPRFRLILAAVMVFIGFFVTSRLSGASIIPLYLAYGVVSGLGIGLVYNTVIATTSAWYPDKKGMCSGWLFMGFGFSTLILGNIAGKMIEMPSIGWRTTFVVLGIAIAAALIICSFLIKAPGPDFKPPVSEKAEASKAVAETDSGVKTDYTAQEMVRRPSFWMLFVFFILFAAVGSTAISFAKDFCVSLGAAGSFAVTMVGILSVFNGLGRLFSGWFFDKQGLRKTQYITSAVAIAATLVSLIAVMTGSLALGIIGISLCGFSYGFSPTVSAAIVAAFYGTKHYALNLGVINLILIPAAFTATLAGSFVTKTGSYVSTFVMLLAFSVVGLIINLFIKKA